MIINESDVTVYNAAVLGNEQDQPAVEISGNQVMLVNAANGTIASSESSVAAILITGRGITIENQAGATIRNTDYVSGDAIVGSDYGDIVIDRGRISGEVNLGAGNDQYIARSDYIPLVNLGDGDDIFRQEVTEDRVYDMFGGSGYDRRYVNSTVSSLSDISNGFEFLSISNLGGPKVLYHFRNYQTVEVESGGDYFFHSSANPDATLQLDASNVRLGWGSTFASVGGGSGRDILDVDFDGKILGDVDLGAGDDALTMEFETTDNVLGDVDLGAGDDILAMEFKDNQTAQPILLDSVQGGSGRDRLTLSVGGDLTVDLRQLSEFEVLTVDFSSGASRSTVTLTELSSFAEVSSGYGKIVIADYAPGTAVRFSGDTLTIAAGAAVAEIEARRNVVDAHVVNLGIVLGDVRLAEAVDYDGRLGRVDGTIFGSYEADTIRGGANDDRIEDSTNAADDIDGGGGNDRITVAGDGDKVAGGDGDDTLSVSFGKAGLLAGGKGDDFYFVDTAQDILEFASEGTDTVISTVDWTLGDTIENLTLSGISLINGTGNGLKNVLSGNTHSNILDGRLGADTMSGGASNDTYLVDDIGDRVIELAEDGNQDLIRATISFALPDNVEDFVLDGDAAIDGTGNGAENHISGNDAANRLDGGAGSDFLVGGKGDDTYVASDDDILVEEANGGTDTVLSGVDWRLADHIEALVLTGSDAVDATGNSDANALTGNDATNILDGAGGADLLSGGKGDDIFIVDDAGDTVAEQAGEGLDEVRTSVSYVLPDAVENIVITATSWDGPLSATGNGADNRLTASAGGSRLDGMAGADTMVGGSGNDSFVVDQAGDVVIVGANGGNDRIISSIDYVLPADIRGLTLTGGARTGTGNARANSIVGSDAVNLIDGAAGADTMLGGLGDDRYRVDDVADQVFEDAGGGHDRVESSVSFTIYADIEDLVLSGTAADATGNRIANRLTGNDRANVIDGGLGADTMIGGRGDDRYVVDDVGDRVVEAARGGFDIVVASVDYTAAANVERVDLDGFAIRATGNALANRLTGDWMANMLDGKAGADTMVGSGGDDRYTVDNAGDRVIELAGEGTDTVLAAIDYAAAAFVERIELTGSRAIDATGNRLDNHLTGNDAANVLDGRGGRDTMKGGGGNDVYYVDSNYDVVIERSHRGNDIVYASASFSLGTQSIETLHLTGHKTINGKGSDGANALIGNDGQNKLSGKGGDDTLEGGRGRDTLVGGTGKDELAGGSNADLFVFARGDTGNNRATADRIVDFSHNQHDRIDLSQIDASTKARGNQAFDFIGNDAFRGHAGELRVFKVDGRLFVAGDTDGDGAADLVIRVDEARDLVAADFLL